ncbi:hypothetical protein TTRE_0000199901 [Trichuris trichiura]|uniref:Uncharacterized protein n=1 Tax=Trichuris trichiura TaxID=36087 RepID=A0A077Z1D1_TRITR|nr:hypothetical protein TTRE_0000199901 [Trichuris trichiura]
MSRPKKDAPVRFRDLYERSKLGEDETQQSIRVPGDAKNKGTGEKRSDWKSDNSKGSSFQSEKNSDKLSNEDPHSLRRQDSLQQDVLERSVNQSCSKAEERSRKRLSVSDVKESYSQLNVSPKTKFGERSRVGNNQEFLQQEHPRRRRDEGFSDTSSDKNLPVDLPSRLEEKVADINSEADSDLKEWIEKKHSKNKDQEKLGGAYIPPMKLKAMHASITDKNRYHC